MTDSQATPEADATSEPAAWLPDVYSISTDAQGIVTARIRSNIAQPGMMVVGGDIWQQIQAIGGPCQYDGHTVTPYAPAPGPQPARQQLGTVFLGAIVDLGWWTWWDQGGVAQASAGKPLDQRYWLSIGKADVVLVTDAKLTRVAKAAEAARVAASGQPAPAAPVITMAAAMDHGDAMMAAGG